MLNITKKPHLCYYTSPESLISNTVGDTESNFFCQVQLFNFVDQHLFGIMLYLVLIFDLHPLPENILR